MTYYGAGDLAASFRQVRGNTIQMAEEIPEAQYGFQAAPECRTVAQTLAHIAVLPRFQLHVHQNGIGDFRTLNFMELIQPLMAEEATPRSKAEILALLESEGEKAAAYLAGLSESMLAERVVMPTGSEPPTKTRFEMLMSLKEHEMHHRGQLMVIQRILGLTPHLTRQMRERMAGRAAAQAAG
jgi:uncharacterized damage-inducible protein DinB